MRGLNVLLSIAVSLVIGLFVLEGGLRILGLGPPKNLNTFDPVTGWSKKADGTQKKHTSEFDIVLETNAFGLRDDAMESRAKAPGTLRAVALGDSFTLGYTVDRADLFVDILERWWRAEERRTDVVNGGTEGWSTDQEVAWFLEEGVKYEPDLVFVFAYENDLYWCAETQYPPDLDKPRFSADGRLEARELVDHAGNRWTDDFALTRLLFRRRPGERFFFTPPAGQRPILKEWGALLVERPDFMADAEARCAGALRALKARCDELGARVVVVPIPSHSFVDEAYAAKFAQGALGGIPRGSWSPDVPVETFLRLAREVGVDSIDVRPALREAAAGGEALYFERDWHFNEHGNAVFAGAVKRAVDERGWFPATHAPTRQVAQAPAPVHPPSEGGVPFALKLFGALWAALTLLYLATYRDEPKWQPPLKVAGLLAAVFTIFTGARWLVAQVPPHLAPYVMVLLVGGILIFVAYKLGHRLGTIVELIKSFTLRGHWYLMPLVVVLLTVGSLLVVAASSPLVAPFIYTLF